jgi:hypothetical protein
MPIEKYYLDEIESSKIDFYSFIENKITLRFWKKNEFISHIDLDLETIEEFVLDLTFAIQKLKNEGGQNG